MNIKVLWEVALLFISFLLAWCNIRIDKAENLSINSNTVLEQISLNEFLTTEDFWEDYQSFREGYLWNWKMTIFDWDDMQKDTPWVDILVEIVPSEESILKEFYGDGVPTLEDFKDGSSLKYTVWKWYSPNDVNIDKEWITPDVEVERDYEKYKEDWTDNQLEAAKEELMKLIE